MAGAELSLHIGQIQHFENGTKVGVVSKEKPPKRVGGTPLHEAIHAALGYLDGVNIVKVSIIPGPGYLGITQFDRFSGIAAVGPHAHGCDGTGWDTHITEATGHSVSSLIGPALAMIAAHWEGIQEVAAAVEEHGEIGHGEVVKAMKRGSRRQEGISDVEIMIQKPNGKTEKIQSEAKEGKVVIRKDLVPGVWEALTLAA